MTSGAILHHDDVQMILQCEQFVHVTGRRNEESIRTNGLDPSKCAITFEGRGSPAICLCPMRDKEKTINYLQDSHPGDPELLIVTVNAETLLLKQLGPDPTWDSGLSTIAESLNRGILCCFDRILPAEFANVAIIPNTSPFKDDERLDE